MGGSNGRSDSFELLAAYITLLDCVNLNRLSEKFLFGPNAVLFECEVCDYVRRVWKDGYCVNHYKKKKNNSFSHVIHL